MARTLQKAALIAVLAAVWQHASAAERAFSYSRQSVSGPPVVGPAQKIAVPDPHGQGQDSYDYVAHPQYRNAYEVADPHSGDFHMHEEQREGDAVKGSYRIHDADGRIRTVHYTADAGGYRAEVTYSSPGAGGGGGPHAHAPAPAPAHARASAPAHAPPPAAAAAHEVHHDQGVLVPPPVLAHSQISSLPQSGGHGQGRSHSSVEGHGRSHAHSQVHQPPRPAPVHEQQLPPLGPSGPQQGRALHADQLRQHRAQLKKHQQRAQHHSQGLAHAQHLAEAQGLAHLQQ